LDPSSSSQRTKATARHSRTTALTAVLIIFLFFRAFARESESERFDEFDRERHSFQTLTVVSKNREYFNMVPIYLDEEKKLKKEKTSIAPLTFSIAPATFW
jgi:hypothetical protein